MAPSSNVFHQATESQVLPPAVVTDFLILSAFSWLGCWGSAIRLHLGMKLSQSAIAKTVHSALHVRISSFCRILHLYSGLSGVRWPFVNQVYVL
jgi:hypothetical protein